MSSRWEEAGWGGQNLGLGFCSTLSVVIGCLIIMTDRIRFAKMLRSRSTDAEQALWRRLRARQISGAKFRRQAPIGPYIVDFISYDVRIVIELDGGQHADESHHQRDVKRDRWLKEQGFLVLRFWNSDVLQNMDGVLSRLIDVIQQR